MDASGQQSAVSNQRSAVSAADRLALFVTGTDTGVGKTVVTAAIASLAVAAGRRTAVYKPAQTGAGDGDDLGFVQAVVGPTPLLRTACAYRLRAPLAPHVAAGLEGVTIDVAALLNLYRDVAVDASVTLVEGAGGLLVPLADRYLMADLARDMGLPLLVVTRPALGTLNHTALTVEAARRRGLEVAGLVICDYPRDPDVAARTNPALLIEMTAAPLLGALPHIDGLDTAAPDPAGLAAVAAASLAPCLGGRFVPGAFLAGISSERAAPGADLSL
jgi:dethiobiotin synthetase